MARQSPSRPRKWAEYPNLLRRPHAPNKGRGRLQRQIRRAFIIHGREVSSSLIYEHAMSWSQRLDGRPLGWDHRWSIVRILETLADRVRREPPYGAWLWRLKDPPHDEQSRV